MKLLKNQRGFTLIEVLVVLLALSLMAGLAAPIYDGYIDHTKEVACKANARTLHLIAELYLLDGGGDTTWAPPAGEKARVDICGAHEGWFPYLDKWPENPLGTGDYVVEIEDGRITVWPGVEE